METRNNKVVNSNASETSTPYTVKLEKHRVVAWYVQQDGEDGGLFMTAVTLPLDPREVDQDSCDRIDITADKYDIDEHAIEPHTVKSVIPASATFRVKIVL